MRLSEMIRREELNAVKDTNDTEMRLLSVIEELERNDHYGNSALAAGAVVREAQKDNPDKTNYQFNVGYLAKEVGWKIAELQKLQAALLEYAEIKAE